jgi:hypothetical protein
VIWRVDSLAFNPALATNGMSSGAVDIQMASTRITAAPRAAVPRTRARLRALVQNLRLEGLAVFPSVWPTFVCKLFHRLHDSPIVDTMPASDLGLKMG